MSGITDPTEEYFKDGTWAWDGTRWQKLLVDGNGKLQVAGMTNVLLDGTIHSDTLAQSPALGRVIVGLLSNGVPKWSILTPGAAGQVLTVQAAGGLDWATPTAGAYTQGARAYHNVNQSIANGVPTMLALNAERYDTDVIHDLAVSNSRLTCRTEGKYLICGLVAWATNGVGLRIVTLLLNGATIIAGSGTPPTATDLTMHSVAVVQAMVVTDYVELRVYQTSGGALNVLALAEYSPELMMQRVG